MIKYIFLVTMVMMHVAGIAQTNVKNTMVLLQECLNLNSNNQRDMIRLHEQTGILEYSQPNIQQRIALSDLQKVEVNANNAGFSVDIKCAEENKCISFIKNDTSNTAFLGTAIQFSDITLANTFAENLSTLITQYKTTEPPLEKKLAKNEQGKTPLLGVKTPAENKAVAVKQTPVENNDVEQKGEDDEPEVKGAKPKLTREERDEARAEKKEEVLRKAAENRESKKEARKNKKTEKEETDNNPQDEPEEKTTARSKRKAAREANQDEPVANAPEEEDPGAKKQTARQKSKTSGNKLIEDVGDDNSGEDKGKAANEFCNQLTVILQSGKENKFKTIEGKLTNAETKINDSKVKLKGTRKNYLSWFKKERAFISELKSGNDYEVLLKDFENLQTQLDECLGAGWDMEDKSNSEEYAKLKTEVKDVEFKKENDETMPTVRVIFLEDNEKFTMFMRIK